MATYVFDNRISGSLLSDVDAKVAIEGLDDINVDTTVGGRLDSAVALTSDAKVATDSTVATTSSLEVAPLTTSSSVDLAPVAVDTCIRVELGSLPATEVTTPWEQRLGLSVLGVELFAWVLCGETTTTLRPARRDPVVVGSVERHGPQCGCGCRGREPRHDRDHDRDHDHDHDDTHRRDERGGAAGLEIRLG